MARGIAVLILFLASTAAAAEVDVKVDASEKRQVYEGFGATTSAPATMRGELPAGMRAKIIAAVYGQVKLTMGNLNVGPLETRGGWAKLQNDNDDPKVIDWSGFDLTAEESMKRLLVDPAAPLGFNDWSLAGNVSWKWAAPWLGKLYRQDRERALDECAEKVLVAVTHWKKLTGSAPRLVHLFNEPTSGNHEMEGADAEAVRDCVKRVGSRLAEAGFGDVKFVAPNEETVRRSIDVAKVILEDPDARRHIAAIGYHCYPYGSAYASVPRILRASGAGRPDPASVRERAELRDLCRAYALPAWMTEVSHSEVDAKSFDHLRGRAIHIHDEMAYADASAFYGMNAFGDRRTHEAHFAGRSGGNEFGVGSDEMALAENADESVLVTGIGYAVGHYSRWLSKGAVRVEATSSDPLVLLTAFRDDAKKRFVLVVINNAGEPRTLNVALSGIGASDAVEGEQSTEKARWQKLPPVAVTAPGRLKLDVPPMSVTTFSAPVKVN